MILLLNCLAVGVFRAEELFEYSEGVTTVRIAGYFVWSFLNTVMKSSITVRIVKCFVISVTQYLVGFANSAEFRHVLSYF